MKHKKKIGLTSGCLALTLISVSPAQLSAALLATGATIIPSPTTQAQSDKSQKGQHGKSDKKDKSSQKGNNGQHGTTHKPDSDHQKGESGETIDTNGHTMAGVGTIIKAPGGSTTLISTGPDGTVVVSGIAPGRYPVTPVGVAPTGTTNVQTTTEGTLTYRVVGHGMQRQVVEGQMGIVPASVVSVQTAFAMTPGQPCDPLPGAAACAVPPLFGFIDVNSSSAKDIVRLAPLTTQSAAQIIVGERAKGPFTSPANFVRRVCAKTNVDFGTTAILIGDTRIIGRSDMSDVPTLRCTRMGKAGTSEVQLYRDSFPIAQADKWLP